MRKTKTSRASPGDWRENKRLKSANPSAAPAAAPAADNDMGMCSLSAALPSMGSPPRRPLSKRPYLTASSVGPAAAAPITLSATSRSLGSAEWAVASAALSASLSSTGCSTPPRARASHRQRGGSAGNSGDLRRVTLTPVRQRGPRPRESLGAGAGAGGANGTYSYRIGDLVGEWAVALQGGANVHVKAHRVTEPSALGVSVDYGLRLTLAAPGLAPSNSVIDVSSEDVRTLCDALGNDDAILNDSAESLHRRATIVVGMVVPDRTDYENGPRFRIGKPRG